MTVSQTQPAPETTLDHFERVTQILGGQVTISDHQDLIACSAEGLPKEAMVHLARYLDLSISQIVELVPVSVRTLQRYAPGTRLSPFLSEHILHLAVVAARGTDIFGERDKFLAWLRHPHVGLGRRQPLALLTSRFGIDGVLAELGRIEHGIVA